MTQNDIDNPGKSLIYFRQAITALLLKIWRALYLENQLKETYLVI